MAKAHDLESSWSLWEAISPEVQLAFNFKTNPANYESHWTTVWHKAFNEILRRIELPETPPSERFTATSQYSLLQRDKTRSQSVPLQTIVTNESDDDDSETDQEGGAEKRVPKTLPLLLEGQPTSDISELNSHLGGLDLDVSGLPMAIVGPEAPGSTSPTTTSPPHNKKIPQTPPRRQQDDAAAEPSSSHTSRARSGRDSKFWVDIALIKGKCVGNKVTKILGYRVCPHIPQLPMLLEAKRSPSRSQPLVFEHRLNANIGAAYDDISLKAPIALKTHQEQKSIIALASSGLWWSFTVVRPTFQAVSWSRVFELGHAPHDRILAQLVSVAISSPEDPVAYEDELARRLLDSNVRSAYKNNEFARRQ